MHGGYLEFFTRLQCALVSRDQFAAHHLRPRLVPHHRQRRHLLHHLHLWRAVRINDPDVHRRCLVLAAIVSRTAVCVDQFAADLRCGHLSSDQQRWHLHQHELHLWRRHRVHHPHLLQRRVVGADL